jgi:hypothetical protein
LTTSAGILTFRELKLRFYNALAACLLIVAIGGHLVLLQCAAWAGMLVSYSHKDGITAGIEKTFDGKHPCALCKIVKKGSCDRQEQNAPLLKSSMKINWMLIEASDFSWVATWEHALSPADESGRLTFILPPTPPPELA